MKRKERPAKSRRSAPAGKAFDRALRGREPRGGAEEFRKTSRRKAFEGEIQKLQGGMAVSAMGLLAVVKIGFAAGAPWLAVPLAVGAVYLLVRSYRKVRSVRAEAERLGLRSDEIDVAAENAVLPFKGLLILGGVFFSVLVAAVLLVWLAQKLQ